MEIIAIIISIIALLISLASYYFNLKSPNQNKIFDEKIQAYSKIATVVDKAVLAFSEGITEGKELRKEKPKGYKEDLNEIAEGIGEAINEMFDVLMANIILVPKDVYYHLDELATFIDSEENFNIFEKPKQIEPLLEELRKKQNEAIKLMRNDLHSDQLNTGLHKRLGGNNLGHKIFGDS
jgi:flagellar biosynthesis/type III secretory pathway chaperone